MTLQEWANFLECEPHENITGQVRYALISDLKHFAETMQKEKTTKRMAPWPDFDGRALFEGDTIIHPSGQQGIVIFDPTSKRIEDQWRVRYQGDDLVSRLCFAKRHKRKSRQTKTNTKHHEIPFLSIGS